MILDRLFGAQPAEQRAAAFGSYMAAVPPPDGSMSMGMPVSPHTAMQSLAVYACVRILADAVATLPVDVYRKPSEGVRQLVPVQPKVVTRPWPHLTLSQWLWCVMQSLTIRGNAYLHIQAYDSGAYPASLFPLHPDSVQVTEGPDNDWTNPQYTVGGLKVPAGQIVHLRRFPIAGQVVGLSPIEQAAQGVGLSISAERYGYRYFKDAANPSSVIETDADLSDEAVRRTQRQWISTHGGSRRPAVLTGGFKWRPISITPEESQFLATRQFQRGEIAMMFGVPPHMIGDTTKATTWGSGIESMGIGFVTFTLRPWLKCLEDAWSDLIPRGQFAQFNIDGLLRGDRKSRWESYQMGRNIGVYSVNEIRAMEDLPPVPDGDGRIQAVNYAPLGFDPAALTPAKPGQPADDSESDPDAQEDPDEDPADEEGDDESSDRLMTVTDALRQMGLADDQPLSVAEAQAMIGVAPPLSVAEAESISSGVVEDYSVSSDLVPSELRAVWQFMTPEEQNHILSLSRDERRRWVWLSDAERQTEMMHAEIGTRIRKKPKLLARKGRRNLRGR